MESEGIRAVKELGFSSAVTKRNKMLYQQFKKEIIMVEDHDINNNSLHNHNQQQHQEQEEEDDNRKF